MDRIAHACAACVAVVASLTLFMLAGVAAGATPCEKQVLADWSDNGRIDRVYPLHCYEDAIDSIPSDLRDYTNAVEVIERALTAAIRNDPTSGDGATSGSQAAPEVKGSASSIPLPLLVLGVLSLTLLAAGAVAWVARRRGRV